VGEVERSGLVGVLRGVSAFMAETIIANRQRFVNHQSDTCRFKSEGFEGLLRDHDDFQLVAIGGGEHVRSRACGHANMNRMAARPPASTQDFTTKTLSSSHRRRQQSGAAEAQHGNIHKIPQSPSRVGRRDW
jgi:hypothetical protein